MVKTIDPILTKRFLEVGEVRGNSGPLSQEIIIELSGKNKPSDNKKLPKKENKPFIPPKIINTR